MLGTRQSPHTEADAGDAPTVIHATPADAPPEQPTAGVTLRGDAARGLRDLVVGAGIETAKAALHTSGTYRLVPPEHLKAGLGKTLKQANASSGDASTLIKNAKTGEIAGRFDLKKAGPSAKVLGPTIAWEAMAMATQQHYLVEINDKLENIEKGVDEILQRMDDDKRGSLNQQRKIVDSVRDTLAAGRRPSASRCGELHGVVTRADEVWHQLDERVVRLLDAYKRGEAQASEVEEAWALLLLAMQVLGEASAVVTALPYETIEELGQVTAEQRERVLPAIEEIRRLAGELHAAHLEWAAKGVEFHLRRTRNPAKKAVRAVRQDAALKPPVGPLGDFTAWRASQLALAPAPPASYLVTIGDDESVRVVAQQADAAALI